MSQPAFAFGRVAIVNRGEPAMRLINAVREWNAEGRPALRVIAVYTAADRHATFVREADEAVLIGPAPPTSGRRRLRREPLPGLRRAGAGAARVPGRRGLAGLGVRLGEGRVRRAVRPAGDHLHRPVGRGDAPASGTRSSPSCWPSRSACRSRRGAAARWPTWRRPARQRSRSATR